MKQEIKDTLLQVVYSSPTSVFAVVTDLTLAQWIALILGTLQALYLIRKWWREETEFGMKLKEWTYRMKEKLTGHGDLR